MNSMVWKPLHPEKSKMWHFILFVNQQYHQHFTNYQQLYQWSIAKPAHFWQALYQFFDLKFTTPAYQILNDYQHMIDARWFSGATFNFAQQLLVRRDHHPALISINEQGDRQEISYQLLYQEVARCAQGLTRAGVSVGDRVAAILPNVSYTIIAMLACAALGAIWSSCSPDFGVQAALDRIGQIAPKVLFIADGHQYLGKIHDGSSKIVALSQAISSLRQIVVCPIIARQLPLTQISAAVYWDDFVQPASDCNFIALPFAHPLYILFSSGTTGKPKCIVHGAGGTLLQHLKELGLHTDLTAQDKLCFYTTCGWMMWNWMVSALALGVTLVLYEGAPNYPHLNRMFELIDAEKITVFGTSAKFISTVEKAGIKPNQHCRLTSLRSLLSTGSPLLPKNFDFVYQHVKANVQLSSISGGTDIISCFALGNPIEAVYKGELQCLGLAMAVQVFNEAGQPVWQQRGELVCINPFPSMPIGFWQDEDHQAYQHAYFERFAHVWSHGDFAEITANHGLIIYGRSDTVLNPGGVRIGTAEIYRQVEKIPEVIDSVVIGQDWQDDVRIVLFVKLRAGLDLTAELKDKIATTLRSHASPRHVPAKILQVADIPRTISGKIVELAVRQVVHGQTINNLHSLANPEALDYFKNRDELGK